MLFNSAEFIFFFLPVVLIGFFYLAHRFSNDVAVTWLVAASLFFYGWWDPFYLLIIVSSMLANYQLGKWLHDSQNRWLLIFGVTANLLVLGYYKYSGFLVWNLNAVFDTGLSIDQIVLPLAISFFTFQQIAYLVDSWQGITGEYRFLNYALFVTFFPQLIAGPIVHHKEMLPQFSSGKSLRPQASCVAIGISIFAIGLFKKTVIADGIALHANPVFNAADAGTAPDLFTAWSGALAYTFQLYFDFSGYSDMAIGLARMFGIILPLNFYSPYKAASISEFWRRWHITLSRFLRDYVYIALGGNRNGPRRRYLYLAITMLLGGLWHGAGWNFIIWGGLHGSYLIVNHLWRSLQSDYHWLKLHTAFSWLITMLAVIVGWVFFRATSFDGAINILQGMAGLNGITLPHGIVSRLGASGDWLEAAGIIAVHGGGADFVSAWLFILILIPLVVIAPNVQDIFSKYRTSLSSFAFSGSDAFWPCLRQLRGLIWAPKKRWAFCSAAMLITGIMTLGQVSDFLYFQF